MIAKRKHSIRGKLTGIIMLTSTIVVLLASLAFEIDEIRHERLLQTTDLVMLSQLVGSQTAAALTFGDRRAAAEHVNAFRAKPSIIAACIYTARGEPFARYTQDKSFSLPKVPPQDGLHDRGG